MLAADSVALTIGPEGTVVREIRTLPLKRGLQEILLEDMPAEADLSTLAVCARRFALELVQWTWGEPPSEQIRVDELGALSWDAASRAGRWYPGHAPNAFPPPRPRGVRCLVRSGAAGPREVELVYRTAGIRWAPAYRVVVRGEWAGEREALSVDFEGTVQIENRTARAFSNAAVRLVGRERELSLPHLSGHLLLAEDNPLSGLWRPRPLEAEPAFTFELPWRGVLPKHTALEIPLVRAQRVPAASVFLLTSETVPLTARGAGTPLPRMVVVENKKEHGLGQLLPAGPATVFPGGMRRQMLPKGALPVTRPGEEIRIELGASPEVLGWRRLVSRTELAEGSYEAAYEIVVRNTTDRPIRVEIVEKPPARPEWNLISASSGCERHGPCLRFTRRVPPRSDDSVRYTLRVRQPSL